MTRTIKAAPLIPLFILCFPSFLFADDPAKGPFYTEGDMLVSTNTTKTSKADEKLLLNPQKLNKYTYGINNPYKYIDPDGQFPQLLVPLIVYGLIQLGELIYPQTLESPYKDSFIDRYSTDLLVMPLGIEIEGTQIASKGLHFAAGKWLPHFEKHAERLGIKNSVEYLARAKNLLSHTKSEGDILVKYRGGDKIVFNKVTEEFAVANKEGVIRTYFKPDPKVHGYKTNLEYFNAQ